MFAPWMGPIRPELDELHCFSRLSRPSLHARGSPCGGEVNGGESSVDLTEFAAGGGSVAAAALAEEEEEDGREEEDGGAMTARSTIDEASEKGL